MIVHKCSYLCTQPIHAVETLTFPDVMASDKQEIMEWFEQIDSVVKVIDAREVIEVDESFVTRANQGSMPNEEYKTWIVMLQVTDEFNQVIMDNQHAIA